MVFTAMVEDGDLLTKTMLDENEVDGVRNVLWEPDDVIGIATYNGTYQSFENILEEPAASGVFEGSVSTDIKYYAIYPYVKNQKMSTSVAVNIPVKQNYKSNSFDGSAAPMVGKGNHAEPLYFMNLTGALAINMTGTAKIKSIVFETTSGEKVSGEGAVDPDYADYPVLTMSETADTYVVLDCGEGVQLSGDPTSFHFVLPPATYNGFKLLISTTDGLFMEKSTDKQLNIKRSIVTKAASFAFENQADNFTNLSERGNANCYIVSQPGYYSFDGTVIGNGEFGFVPENNFHTNTPEIAPASVDVLWETKLGLIRGCGFDPKSGKVKFVTSGTEGNAVLAAKDAEGNIIWSWHIWMTDQPEEQIYNNDAGIMMDRNLGATSATPGDVGALGLLYQWGRKDPFLSSASISSNVEPTSTITWPSAIMTNASVGSIAYAVMNPTTFIKNNGTNRDWYYTGTSDTDNSRWQSVKTIYDPCPSGWRVPDGGKEGIWAKAIGSSSDASGYTYDSNSQSMAFSGKFSDASSVWYPAAGYRTSDQGALSSVADRGYYWSVTSNTNDAFAFRFYDNGNIYPTFAGLRACGFSVRCMKDDGYVDISYPQVSITGFEDVTTSSVTLKANIKSEGVSSVTERGFIYGLMPDLSDGTKVQCGNGGGEFSYILSGLTNATKYYVKAYAINSRGETQSITRTLITKYTEDTIELSSNGTSNCYQVAPLSATYGFDCSVKGNTPIPIGNIVTLDVIWETDSYMRKADSGTIISSLTLSNSMALFTLSDNLNEGNALIAAKDENGTILWSWHIWVTDTPVDHIYINGDDRFVVQDRHLGATRGDNGNGEEWKESCGIDYQWGRKDPFSAGNFTSTNDSFTIEQSIQNPTVRAKWSREAGLWSSYTKTMYDPCPVGYRVAPHEVYKCLQYTEDLSDNGEFFIYDGVNAAWYPFRGNPTESGSIDYWGDNYMWDSSRTDRTIRYASNYIALNQSGVGADSRCPIRCIKDDSLYEGEFSTIGARSLSDAGTANSYIVSSAGTYSFPAVKGNSSESVGLVASVEVLWETYGTDEKVFRGALVSGVKYENGQIYFKTPDAYKEGNAVIAAKNENGTILWSWHIWFTDRPQEQVYPDNGTMMDRNLGATSATTGDVGALGLLYQWGRKDPFLGSSSISSNTEAVSTISWPTAVASDPSTGTVDYVTNHPTTYITAGSDSSYDWHYSSRDDLLWKADKTIYDPCPAGWRVPSGGINGVWSRSDLTTSGLTSSLFDETNKGMSLSLSNESSTWYPASGLRSSFNGGIDSSGLSGCYWSVTPATLGSYYFGIYYDGVIDPLAKFERASGFSIRCTK